MATSVIGSQFLLNVAHPQGVGRGSYLGTFAIAVNAPSVLLPTEQVGWCYVHYVRGTGTPNYGQFFVRRAAITRGGCAIVVPSIPGIIVGGDTFAGYQFNAFWFRQGIDYDTVWNSIA